MSRLYGAKIPSGKEMSLGISNSLSINDIKAERIANRELKWARDFEIEPPRSFHHLVELKEAWYMEQARAGKYGKVLNRRLTIEQVMRTPTVKIRHENLLHEIDVNLPDNNDHLPVYASIRALYKMLNGFVFGSKDLHEFFLKHLNYDSITDTFRGEVADSVIQNWEDKNLEDDTPQKTGYEIYRELYPPMDRTKKARFVYTPKPDNYIPPEKIPRGVSKAIPINGENPKVDSFETRLKKIADGKQPSFIKNSEELSVDEIMQETIAMDRELAKREKALLNKDVH